jgi:phage/plasmid-associated DNA primase
MTEQMNIIDYCNHHKIKTLPIKLEVKDKKKRYLSKQEGRFEDGRYNHKMTDFNEYTFNQCKTLTELYLEETDWIAIDTNTVHQVDIDDPAWWEDAAREDQYDQWYEVPYYKSATKGCPHYFFYPDHGKYSLDFGNRYYTKDIDYYEHDILTGQWAYAHKDQLVFHSNHEIPKIWLTPDREKQEIKPKNPVATTPAAPATPVECNTTMDPFQKAILDNINPDKYYKYSEWSKYIWAIKFTCGEQALEIAVAYSRALDNFVSEEDVQKTMDSAIEARIGWGYLMNLSKLSNKEKHYSIVSEHSDFLKDDDYSLAQVAMKLLQTDVIRTPDNQFYIYKQPYWVLDQFSELRAEVCTKLRDFYYAMHRDYAERLKNAESEDEMKLIASKQEMILKLIKKVNSNHQSKQITEQFAAYFTKVSIEFDTYKPYYFCFTNCAFDLRTNKQVTVEREHYITQTTGYDYISASPEQLAKVKALMKQIFPKEDNLLCYVSIMRTCMIGLLFEKFVMANGSGGNGKGLINSLMAKMLGPKYFYKASITTLVEKIKDGANPAIANMNKARCVLTSEPRDEDKLNLGNIKQLTGENTINARGLYQSNCIVILLSVLILECNKKPKIDGRVDDSLIRRFVNVFFESIFTNKEHLLQFPNYHRANPEYKTDEWQEVHKRALFDYLLTFDYIDIYEPKSIQDSTYDYLCENDDFTHWLDTNYTLKDSDDKPDDKCTVKLKDMCSHYKERFLHQGSREYRHLTVAKFLEKLQENIRWKHIVRQRFKDRYQRKGVQLRSVFIGMEQRYNDDSGDESD